MRCASVSVGIVDYEHEDYRDSSMRLLHAAADADAFHQYARTAWDGEDDVHIPPMNGNATLPSLERTFREIAGRGSFDLLVVYLSGHGELGADLKGWFCLADARPGSPSLGPGHLDRLLGETSADRVLLLVDCCHAEAAVEGMGFFCTLDGRLSRLFVASARARQRSWEDDSLKRSLFSDVLLRALSSDSDIAEAGAVDVEGRLLKRLREQVPLNAAARKRGAVQEPVSGGCSVTSTLLPTVSSRSLGRELSVAETVRRRARRVLGVATLVLAGTLLLIDALAYHLTVAGDGEILLRPGIAATYGLLPFHLGEEADTGFALADIEPSDDRLLARLDNSAVWGVSSHFDTSGLRPWLAELEPGMRDARRSSASVLATGNPANFKPDRDLPPLREAAFLATLSGRPVSAVGREIYPLRTDKPNVACDDNAGRVMDMELLMGETEVFVRDVQWFALTASDDPPGRAGALSDLVLLSAYRAFHETSEASRIAELRAVAAAGWRLASTAVDPQGFRREAARRLASQRTQWCSLHVETVLALLSPADGSGDAAEAALLSRFEKPYKGGRLAEATADERLAAVALAEIGRYDRLRPASLAAIEALALKEGLDLSSSTPTSILLTAIAPFQRFPATLSDALLAKMKAAPEEFDFSPQAAFPVLASNARFLGPEAVAQVRRWAVENGPKLRTMSDFHRGLGYLAAFGEGLQPQQIKLLEDSLSPLSRFSPEALNYRGVPIISATDDDALVALGLSAQMSAVPDALAERLVIAAAGRPTLEGRAEILKGLAVHWYLGVDTPNLTDAIKDRFSRSRMDATRRDIEAEAAAERIASLDAADALRVESELVSKWREQREPELRVAIANTIAMVSMAVGR